MLCDNESVVKSTGKSESTLTKKHNSICWHSIREAVSQGWMNISWEPTESNLADLFTKALPITKRHDFLSQIFQQYYYHQEGSLEMPVAGTPTTDRGAMEGGSVDSANGADVSGG